MRLSKEHEQGGFWHILLFQAITMACQGLCSSIQHWSKPTHCPHSQGAIRSWRVSEEAEPSLLFILPLTQMWINYIQGAGGLLCTVHGWSILSCAKARGFRLLHSYVFDTGILPTVEDNDRYLVQYTPHHSYIPEGRLLHKHNHKLWLYPKWLHRVIIQISECSHKRWGAFQTQESHHLHSNMCLRPTRY